MEDGISLSGDGAGLEWSGVLGEGAVEDGIINCAGAGLLYGLCALSVLICS